MKVRIQPASDAELWAQLKPIILLHNRIKAGRKGGLIGGKTTASISGHMAKAGSIGGKIGGKLGGRKTADLQIGVHDPKVREEATRLGGEAQGRANVLSGHLDNIRTREVCSLGGKVAGHRRYHVTRNRFNPKCDLCTGLLEDKNAS
jgi:hypothetical protein